MVSIPFLFFSFFATLGIIVVHTGSMRNWGEINAVVHGSIGVRA